MLNAGLNCVEYKNGARHTLSDYADMALKTANKRAYLRGEGEKRAEWGISTVVVNSRQGGCPKCAEYIGKVYIDDVYSNGSAKDGNYPLLSVAIQGGLFHPRCKDSTSTYFEGISECKPVSREEMAEMERREQLEQKQQYADRQSKRFARRSKYSLDPDNKRVCSARAEEWQSRAESLKSQVDKEKIKNIAPTQEQKNAFAETKYKFDNVKSISELEKQMQNITNKHIDLNGTDLELMKRNMEQIANLGREYGYNFTNIEATSGRAYLGEVSRSGRRGDIVTIKYPKKYYKNRNALMAELKKSAESGSMPPIAGRNIDIYTSTHEFAHTLSEELTTRLYGYGKEVDFWDEIETVYSDYKKRGNNVLGKYAGANQNEFMAEAFANAKLHPSPTEWSEKTLEIVDKYYKKTIAKSADGGIINTGATAGALSPYSKAAEKHAIKYYESVRHMTTDTQKISEATKISQDKIDKIKKHVFIDEHDLLEGRKRFTPSYDMAESWQRLIKGDYQEKDMILLKHEYYELRSMEKGLTQNEAHIKASKRYNYSKYCE